MKTFADHTERRHSRTSCRLVQAALVEYLEGQLPAGERDSIAAHLKSCPRCAAERISLQKTLTIMSRREFPEPDERFWMELKGRVREGIRDDRAPSRRSSPVPARAWAPAAVAAAMVVFVFLWWAQPPLPPAPGPRPTLSHLELEGRQSLKALGDTYQDSEAILFPDSPGDSLVSLLAALPRPSEILEQALLGVKMAEEPDLWESVIEEETHSERPVDALLEELSEDQLRKLSVQLNRLFG